MSCWVVPTIAAELWGVTLDHVLGGVDEGMVRSRQEHGFLLVDVAPFGAFFRSPRRAGPRPRVQTFTVLTPAEYDALHGAIPPALAADDHDRSGPEPEEEPEAEPQHHDIQDAAREPFQEPLAEVVTEVVVDPELGPDPNDEPDDGRPLRWREGRNRAARMRRRPPG
jgi:hypothetical protein